MADRLSGKAPTGASRSPLWSRTRDAFLDGRQCAVCGGSTALVAHHVVPFHLAPDLELDPDNLIPLCEANRYGVNCHLLFGHLGNYRRINVSVRADAAYWHQRLILDR